MFRGRDTNYKQTITDCTEYIGALVYNNYDDDDDATATTIYKIITQR